MKVWTTFCICTCHSCTARMHFHINSWFYPICAWISICLMFMFVKSWLLHLTIRTIVKYLYFVNTDFINKYYYSCHWKCVICYTESWKTQWRRGWHFFHIWRLVHVRTLHCDMDLTFNVLYESIKYRMIMAYFSATSFINHIIKKNYVGSIKIWYVIYESPQKWLW